MGIKMNKYRDFENALKESSSNDGCFGKYGCGKQFLKKYE